VVNIVALSGTVTADVVAVGTGSAAVTVDKPEVLTSTDVVLVVVTIGLEAVTINDCIVVE